MALEATGERLVPERQRGELVHAEHLARYRYAAQLAGGRRVLDAACGEGYGTAMLSAAGAAEAVGLDASAEAVAHASERYGLEFHQGDVAELPFEDERFELAVSFETIEHVPDPERALAELRRVLAPDGLLVISTPNKARYLDDNEFHVREFTHEEFVAMLEGIFPAVRTAFQQNWLASAVLDEQGLAAEDGDRVLELDVSKVAGERPGEELYTVAVCGRERSEDLRQVAVAAGVFEAQELARLYRAWTERAAEAERQAEEARATISRIEASASWRLTKPLRAAGGRLREFARAR